MMRIYVYFNITKMLQINNTILEDGEASVLISVFIDIVGASYGVFEGKEPNQKWYL